MREKEREESKKEGKKGMKNQERDESERERRGRLRKEEKKEELQRKKVGEEAKQRDIRKRRSVTVNHLSRLFLFLLLSRAPHPSSYKQLTNFPV